MPSSSPEGSARTLPACPLCGRPRSAAFRPFCSRTCQERDLLNWLGGRYAIPGPPADPALLPDEGAEDDGPT